MLLNFLWKLQAGSVSLLVAKCFFRETKAWKRNEPKLLWSEEKNACQSTIFCSWDLETCFNNLQRGGLFFFTLITEKPAYMARHTTPTTLHLHSHPAPESSSAQFGKPTAPLTAASDIYFNELLFLLNKRTRQRIAIPLSTGNWPS